jgi:hypothetical protein
VPAKRPTFAMTWETPSGDSECLLDAEDERLRVSWMIVLRNRDDRDRIRVRVGLFRASIGVGGVQSVISGVGLVAIGED